MAEFNYVACNNCGMDDASIVAVQRDFRYVKCRGCGLVYMNPRPDAGTLQDLYAAYHQRNGKDGSSWEVLMKENFRTVAQLLTNRFPSGGRLLDIGCGYGHFLEIMERKGWNVKGIDPSEHTVSYARKKGLNAVRTTVDEEPLPEETFHAVTMFYVLEHLLDPLAALKKIYLSLIPGGLAVIRVPHTTPLVRLLSILHIHNDLYDAPFHLYDFSPRTIRGLLARAGFSSNEVTPGEPTSPPLTAERIVSVLSGSSAKFLYKLSGGLLLLPGTSKTIYAFKQEKGAKGL